MFDSNNYQEVRKPLLDAQTLPPHCYTEQVFFEKEKQRLFAGGWHFVGREDELAEPGSVLVVETMVGSALVCCDQSGHIHGYINACRHRGTKLREKSGHCRQLTCPYHAWSYGLDGQLRSAPGMAGVNNFELEDYPLKSVRLESFGGFLFINFNIDALALAEWIGDLPDVMRSHQLSDLRCVKRINFTIEANWKFLIENALEAYHTGTVHRSTLGAQDSESVDTRGHWDALYVLSDETKSIATLPGENQGFGFIEGLNEKARRGTWFTVIYPCTQIVFSQDCVWWLDFKPVNVSRTKLTIGACFPSDTIALPDFHGRVAPYYERWTEATAEDNAIAEAQQRGHQAGLRSAGRFTGTEHCVHQLDNWVLDRVLD
ncbi:MAG: Rieske 2Fe-2S domain-containing protein [Gammaproteobacteria bacterium]|nr:Rieske 2Fe-2S domain-containing protein [Gammaproteobacteria bacterium]NKB63592.1 Rieske 2Fe-2S domain-containing protein [Gammaproteobacteria bacterium]